MTHDTVTRSAQLEACSSVVLLVMLASSYKAECALQDDVMQLSMFGKSHFSESEEAAASLFSSIYRILEPADDRYFMLEILATLKARFDAPAKD